MVEEGHRRVSVLPLNLISLTPNLEAVSGRKLRKKGDFSMKHLCRNQHLFFENFPVDEQGNTVRLVEFDSMQDDHIVLWRDHLLASYSSKPPAHPFKIKTRKGRMPELTVLQMKKNSTSSVHSKRGALTRKKRSTRSTTSGKRRSLARKASEEEEEEEEEAALSGSETYSDGEENKDELLHNHSNGSDTYSEGGDGDEAQLPPRSNPPRRCLKETKAYIKVHAVSEAAYVEREEKKRNAKKGVVKEDPPSPPSTKSRRLPGSVEQLQKKANAAKARSSTHSSDRPTKTSEVEKTNEEEQSEASANNKIPNATSMYLQMKSMVRGTLPGKWKKRSFNAHSVSPCSMHVNCSCGLQLKHVRVY